jgi:hypothetical protein
MSCMSPYSMPLWTILTKWPAPSGPSHSQQGVPVDLGGDGLEDRFHVRPGLGVPPGMMEGPSSAPSSPPETPAPT